jgi:hypothetical protein
MKWETRPSASVDSFLSTSRWKEDIWDMIGFFGILHVGIPFGVGLAVGGESDLDRNGDSFSYSACCFAIQSFISLKNCVYRSVWMGLLMEGLLGLSANRLLGEIPKPSGGVNTKPKP